ncbi:hypothetical protein SUGI_0115010 [Cryptomeria japonica]|uniref:uncharacterized protein LOC131054294 n=1 Tax=Cryptomeria japonica TaxID=3369 RepID=UPI00240898BC|nr:uncharacterized protein LOC131054294 [Cryptomeria japonica]GLJ09738.1 hypothetical protein SUGI_0115010 [Cryptomeria japonica]
MVQETSSDSSSDKADRPSGELTQPKDYEKLLTILWPGIEISVMLEAYKNFDSELLTSIHNKARLYLTHPQIGKVLLMHETPEQDDEGSHEATESLDELVPVKIKDLEIGKWNEYCVIYGVLCVKPFKFGRIYTLLEEVDTGNAVALSIVSSDPSSIHQGFAGDKYPQGMKIAVKEPVLVRSEGGIVFIVLRNSWCIEAVHRLPDPQIDERKINEWIIRGNASWQAKDWEKCRRFNTKTLLCVSRSENEYPKNFRLLYNQRWSANIMLGRYTEALQDAEWICRNSGPSESNGIQFKIQSLLSVGRYKDAFRFFQISCASLKEKEQIFTRTYRKWSLKYAYGHEFVPDGGFIGPVEIRMTSNGSGRGLFATEDVQTGETLLLSEPLAVSRKALQDPIRNGLIQNVKNALVSNGEKTLQIFLSHGSCKQIPNMLDFFQEKSPKPSEKLREKLAGKDDEIRQIIERIALDDRSLDLMTEKQEDSAMWNLVPERLYYGVWLLPSFINHSCVPNAARKTDKEIMSIHATKRIQKGEEITIPYFEVLVPFPYRQKYCKAFGFDCICKRCELEKRFLDFESKGCKSKIIYDNYSNACKSKIQDRPIQLEKLVNQVEKYLCVLRQRQSIELGENGEAWIRSSFMATYLARISCRRKRVAVKAPSKTEEETLFTVARAIRETCPGDVDYLTFCESLRFIYSNKRLYTESRSSMETKMALVECSESAGELMKEAFLSVFAQQLEDYEGPDGTVVDDNS